MQVFFEVFKIIHAIFIGFEHESVCFIKYEMNITPFAINV